MTEAKPGSLICLPPLVSALSLLTLPDYRISCSFSQFSCGQ